MPLSFTCMAFYIAGGWGRAAAKQPLRPDLRPPLFRPRAPLPISIFDETGVANLSWQQASNAVPPLPVAPRPRGPCIPAPEVAEPAAVEGKRPIISDDVAAKRKRKDVDDRTAAVSGLVDIMETYFSHAPILEQIFAEDGCLDPVSDSITALFFVKSTGTLQKRLASLRIYGRWFVTEGLEKSLFLEENIVFRYTRFLYNENAPATRASSLREALNFMGGILSLSLKSMQESRRIKGMCCRLQRSAHAVRQRDPLSQEMLVQLEKLLVSEAAAGTIDAVLASTTLFGVYSRARVGDMRRCEVEPYVQMASDRSSGTIETRFLQHKTARPGTKRALPVAAPAFALTSACWAEHFVIARQVAGLHAGQGGCLVPARGRHGWLPVPYTTAEYAMALRDLLLRLGFATKDISNIGSHSLKATMLAWAGRWGMEKDHRRLLGYHTQAADRSADTYVRDLLAAPLRSLQRMLSEISRGAFVPDGLRTEAFPQQQDKDAEEDDSLSLCSSESEAASEDEPLAMDEDVGKIIINQRSLICHIVASDTACRCGKGLPKLYTVVDAPPAESRLCVRCF